MQENKRVRFVQKCPVTASAQDGFSTLHIIAGNNMFFSEAGKQAIAFEGNERLLLSSPGGNAGYVALLAQRFKRCAHLLKRQKRLLKMDATWLAALRGSMTGDLRIQFIAQIPLLKHVLAKRPERAVARKDIFDCMPQYLTGIDIEAIEQIEAHQAA